MNNQWYYVVNGEQQGPLSTDQLKQMLQSGTIKGDDLIWREGLAEWSKPTALPELASAVLPLNEVGQPVAATPVLASPTPQYAAVGVGAVENEQAMEQPAFSALSGRSIPRSLVNDSKHTGLAIAVFVWCAICFISYMYVVVKVNGLINEVRNMTSSEFFRQSFEVRETLEMLNTIGNWTIGASIPGFFVALVVVFSVKTKKLFPGLAILFTGIVLALYIFFVGGALSSQLNQ